MTDTIEPACVAGILVDKAVAAIAAVADSPKGGRPVLSCIHIRNGRAYAADGFRAMSIDLPQDSVSDPDALNIRAKSLLDAVKTIGRNATGQNRYVNVERTGNVVELITSTARFAADTVDGTYPDIESLYPRNENSVKASISFNASYLADVLDAMSKAGVESNMVTLKIYGSGDHERIVLTGEIPQPLDNAPRTDVPPSRRISAVVMPMVRTK